MDSISIRAANDHDFTPIATLRAGSLGTSAADVIKRFRYEFEKNFGSPTWKMFVAHAGSELIGYGRCQFYNSGGDESLYGTERELPSGWYLRGIVVARKFQRQGVARLLTVARLNWLQEKTAAICCFLDSDEKVSVPMYTDLGFREVSRHWHFKDKQRTDTGILLRLSRDHQV